jgi:diguanylate cyclase (GGDEF)-like protein
VSLLMCDIDHFKEINDVYGHDRGDTVLRDVAYEMRKQLRSFELLYRLGGEEFLVVLPGVGRHRALDIAERLRTSVAETGTSGVHVTMCVGISFASGDDVVFEQLYKDADLALYEAKRHGRNSVAIGTAAEFGGQRHDDSGAEAGTDQQADVIAGSDRTAEAHQEADAQQQAAAERQPTRS